MLGRILKGLTIPYSIQTISSGSARNAIPRTCQVQLMVEAINREIVIQEVTELAELIKIEYIIKEPEFNIQFNTPISSRLSLGLDESSM